MRTWANRFSLLLLAACLMVVALPAPSFSQGGPYQYHSLTPCRLADTRTPVGDSGGPILASLAARSFPVQGLCGVPPGATAVTVNVTAIAPTGPGFFTLYPTGITQPTVSNLNFAAGEPALGNGAIVPLADQSTYPLDLTIYAKAGPAGGTVHMVLDVTGYFATTP